MVVSAIHIHHATRLTFIAPSLVAHQFEIFFAQSLASPVIG
jgi:hypothetical protein